MNRQCPRCHVPFLPGEKVVLATKMQMAATVVGDPPRSVPSVQFRFHPECFALEDERVWKKLGDT
jgi:hypothetical protein